VSKTDLKTFKAKWREQLFKDTKLKPSTFKLGYYLVDFCTLPESGRKYKAQGKVYVWPSQKTLAEGTNLSFATVSTGIARLIRRGHLVRVSRGNQEKGSSKYRLLMPRRAHMKSR